MCPRVEPERLGIAASKLTPGTDVVDMGW